MRTTFAKTLVQIARKNRNIFLLTADLGFKLFDEFRSLFPKRFLNVGVAEQNLVGVSAGLSLSGKNVYCYSMVPFLLIRALELIRVNLCYQQLNVKLIGVGGGLTCGLEGMTHHAIEDLAIARALPNMTAVAPGDAVEAEAIIIESVKYPGPLYIRLGGNNDPIVHRNSPRVSIGKGILLREGKAVTILSTGTILPAASAAVDILGTRGIWPTLISLHTIKPLDVDLVMHYARRSMAIFTLEEHNVIGGFGSAIGEVLLENGYNGLFRRIGLPDQYRPAIGGVSYLRRVLGLTPEGISKRIMDELKSHKVETG